MRKHLIWVCAMLFLACSTTDPKPPVVVVDDMPPPELTEARGTWILDTKFASKDLLETTIKRLADHGFNLAYIRTWYRGSTAYPSDVLERAGGKKQHDAFVGRDPIAEAIEIGKKYGVKIATWMEYGLVLHLGTSETDIGGIFTKNPDWQMKHITNQYNKPAANLWFVWGDPSHPGVRKLAADMAAEIAKRYPDLYLYEGDRFRYPSLEWGYSEYSLAKYKQEMGKTANPAPTDPDFIQWRRKQTNQVMKAVYKAVKAANKKVRVSSAVVPPYMIDTSEDKLQYWKTWADSSYVDVLEPMLYSSNHDSFINMVSQAKALAPKDFRLYIGADISGSQDPAAQVNEIRKQSAKGIVFWYETILTDAKAQTLKEKVFN